MVAFNSRKIAFYGVLSALMYVFLLIETYVFTAFLGSFTPAILTLPFAIAISLFNNKKSMLVGGLIFGCCSFVLAINIANPIFINPLISIFPRVFIGIVAYAVYQLAKLIFKNSKSSFISQILPIMVAGLFGVLTNTVCTLCMIEIFHGGALATVMQTIISFNFLGEIVGAVALVPLYSKVLKRVENRL